MKTNASHLRHHREVLDQAITLISGFAGHTLDVLEIAKPTDLEYAVHLGKVVSKLSPMLGNTIEYRAVNQLNTSARWGSGRWVRQDPGFPDTIFRGDLDPAPGIEIKTWFPLATEITARFRDSVTRFPQDRTLVAMLAWVPEHIIYGKPCVIRVWVDSARSVAEARDKHYHRPPDYIVFEPEDTSGRTANLRQTNTQGYKFQGTDGQLKAARKRLASWGLIKKGYDPSPGYQARMRELRNRYPYRLDSNFSKMDRIKHAGLEEFKALVLSMEISGRTITEWKRVLAGADTSAGRDALAQLL